MRASHRLLAVATAGTLAAGIGVVVANPAPSRPPLPPAAAPPAATAVPITAGTPSPAASPDPAASPRRTIAHEDGVAPAATRLSTSWGIDVSWPQCGTGGLPTLATGFVMVGVNDGRPFTTNPCLAAQVTYAKAHTGYSAYLNIDAPRGSDPTVYGRQVARDGLARARAAGLRLSTLWLDVEVKNHWSDPRSNIAVIAAAVRTLAHYGVVAGVYSSQPMWQRITGGVDPRTPVWLATTVTDYRDLDPWCASGLGGRPAVIAQYVATTGTQLVDVDVLCSRALPQSVTMFAAGNR